MLSWERRERREHFRHREQHLQRPYGKKVHGKEGQKEGQYGWSQEHKKSVLNGKLEREVETDLTRLFSPVKIKKFLSQSNGEPTMSFDLNQDSINFP